MSITAEHRYIAARIDARMRQLEGLKLEIVEIIPAMADYMPDFYQLMQSTSGAEINALGDEFPGLYRFAKILETLASGIAAGKIKVPGKKPASEEDIKTAAAIDLRVRQLEAKGIVGTALFEPMVGYILDLQRLWSTTSDEALDYLCDEYPALYRYGMLMEDAAIAESQKVTTSYGHLPQFPASIKESVAQLLANGATLERELQTIVNMHKQHDRCSEIKAVQALYQQWTAQLSGLTDELRVANIPQESQAILLPIFESMAQRINHLQRQILK